MRTTALILLIIWSTSTYASHNWGGLDLCALYPEVMPPGIAATSLPEPDSQGANLMQTYCTQCHELPGPGRHTATEWSLVLKRMTMLSDVASRFGGLMGKVDTPNQIEQLILSDYLNIYALKAMQVKPQGTGAVVYENHCGSCHSLPDPAYYKVSQWPQLIKRMQSHMQTMKYLPPSTEAMMQIQLYLQQHSLTSHSFLYADTSRSDKETMVNHQTVQEPVPVMEIRTGSIIALGPFLLLAIIGLIRWWKSNKEFKPSQLHPQKKI